jgi:phage terminase large subunit
VRGSARQNEEFFQNPKAQAWWDLRARFELTHRAVVDKAPFEPNAIISFDSHLGELQ